MGALLIAAEDGVCPLGPTGDMAGAGGSPRVTVMEAGGVRVPVTNGGRDWKLILAVIRTHICDFPPQLV